MTFNAGDVVVLKSGGQALTVASVEDGEALCLWIGEEGDFFRERIPVAALTGLDEMGPEDEEDEDEETGDGEDE
ncbi:YodC family protein [Phreatobacter sp.]|uniref:YodC family protein n=1 Tax=Phreatobacter sp. TaxID=1966341 RepID=UPI003F6E9565